MLTVFDSAFSPFARKVRMVIEHKGLEADYVDGLSRANHDRLRRVNGRLEAPVLIDGDVAVANSADIVAYLDHRYPERPVFPADPAQRARARSWERTADSLVDAILVDVSLWRWAERDDDMPEGLLEKGRRDLDAVYHALERELGEDDYVCGVLTIADIALFPHLAAAKFLGAPIEAAAFPKLAAWLARMGSTGIGRADLSRARAFVGDIDAHDLERRKIFWRGDRIEWLLANGYHEWFMKEIAEERVLWPGLGLPPAANGDG